MVDIRNDPEDLGIRTFMVLFNKGKGSWERAELCSQYVESIWKSDQRQCPTPDCICSVADTRYIRFHFCSLFGTCVRDSYTITEEERAWISSFPDWNSSRSRGFMRGNKSLKSGSEIEMEKSEGNGR